MASAWRQLLRGPPTMCRCPPHGHPLVSYLFFEKGRNTTDAACNGHLIRTRVCLKTEQGLAREGVREVVGSFGMSWGGDVSPGEILPAPNPPYPPTPSL